MKNRIIKAGFACAEEKLKAVVLDYLTFFRTVLESSGDRVQFNFLFVCWDIIVVDLLNSLSHRPLFELESYIIAVGYMW